ncbi:MAG: S8 family serine peptidase [Kiritimatiellae bacterium]|nr:S8 family serine peptidase [Kiritimatiellia bacterium]
MNKNIVAVSMAAVACVAGYWWFAAGTQAESGANAPAQAEASNAAVNVAKASADASKAGDKAVDSVESVQAEAESEAVAIRYRQVDKSLPRERQAATANRLFVAPETGCCVEEAFSSTQTPSARGTAPYVVIPDSLMGDVKIGRLDEIGAPTLGFFPPNGILTELTPEQFAALKTDAKGFSLVGEWRAEDKISPYVSCDGEKTEIVVSTFNPSDLPRVAEIVRSLGGSVQSQGDDIHGWMRIDLPSGRDKVVSLASHGEIHWIEQHTQPTVANYNSVQTIDLDVTPVWGGTTLNLTGKGQKVVVCDTGLDTGDADTVLSDFRGRIIDMVDIGGYGTCVDGGGHGTHVAGSLFGNGATSSNAKYKGVAYEAEAVIFACGTGTAGDDTMNFQNSGYYNLFARNIDTYGFRIFNASWGDSHTGAYGYWSQAADSDVANHPYLLISAASGNNNYSADQKVCLLGTSKNALTVGAMVGNTAYSGNAAAGIVWPRSLYGTVDGRFKPDLIAPGVGIISTKSTRSALSDATDSNYNTISGYADMDGTSMATPLASGCATLLRQWLVEQRGMSEPSSALMKAILTGGAKGSQPTEDAGWGCIDLKNSIAPDGAEVFLYDYITNNTANAVKLVAAFTITNTTTFKAQLAWIDPMATFGASPALVMDHDLVVSNATTGAILKGNDFSSSGNYDTLNNVEGVRVTSPTVGDKYYVYLRGRTDQSGKLTVPAIYVSAGAEPIEIEPEETDYLAHCYTFDSGMTGTGYADDCFEGENSADTYSETVETSGHGNAMVTKDGELHPHGTLSVSGDFSVSLFMRSVETTNAVLFCIGNTAQNGIVLAGYGKDQVKVYIHSGSSAQASDIISVSNATNQYHHYVLNYANGTYSIYVDGTEVSTQTIEQSNYKFQLGGMHGGGDSHGLTRVSGVAVDDFRVYSKALTADEIAALAAEFTPWPEIDTRNKDELGLAPAHWYKFDSGLEGIGSADDCLEGEKNANTYSETVEATANGNAMVTQENADNNDLALHPYGTMTNATNFAVTLSLKSVETTNAVLFCVGNTAQNGIALAGYGTDQVKVYIHRASGDPGYSIMNVPNATSQYHHYTLNYTNGVYYVYVDGALAKSTSNANMTFTLDQSNRQFQLGGLHGGVTGHDLTRVSGIAVDDFRVYAQSLTAAQIATLAQSFPPWPLFAKPASDIAGLSFGYYFNGGTDGNWATIGNWSRNAEYTNSVSELVLTSGNVPATTGSEVWDPIVFDGDLMPGLTAGDDGMKHVTSPESTSSGQQVEGWELKFVLTNSVRVTIGKLAKIQSDTKFVVDETSRLEINGYAGGNVNGDHWFHIAAPSGMVFNTALNGNTQSGAGNMYYDLGSKGSVQYGALSGRVMPHVVKYITLDLGDTNLTGKAVVSRKLIGFTSNSGHTFNADGVTVASTVASVTPDSVSSVSDSNDIGTYCFSLKSDGYYVDYVAYAAAQTIELNVNLEGEAESKVTANAEAVQTLLAKEGVTKDNINSLASNGLRVWQNAMLGLTPPETTTEAITLSITMENGSPVVAATSTGLSSLGLLTSDPEKTITCGNITATVTLQQAATPNPESWSTADTTSATARFYRIKVEFKTAE